MRAQSEVLRFACAQCGKCCNRAPEIELSEAAELIDIFVFRLMFRLYWLPQQARDYRQGLERPTSSNPVFFERKRLLSAFSARRYPTKLVHEGKRVAFTKYLVISALALDTIEGECSALRGNRCGIYERRPLSCRSVPLHYSRAQASAAADLEAFLGTSGYQCDTSDAAPVIIKDGRIVDPQINAARSAALKLGAHDRTWSEAIVRRMGGPLGSNLSLPSIEEIEANARIGAVTVSMRAAWKIAADTGLITAGECDRLVALQLQTIRRELASGRCSQGAIETLREMEKEYVLHPERSSAIAMN